MLILMYLKTMVIQNLNIKLKKVELCSLVQLLQLTVYADSDFLNFHNL